MSRLMIMIPVCLLIAAIPATNAADAPKTSAANPATTKTEPSKAGANATANPTTLFINEQIQAGYTKADIKKPAARATDNEYLRRAFIDLIGRIPTAEEVLDFEQDKSADKRPKLIHRLLNERAYQPTVNGRKVKLPTVHDSDYADYATQHANHWANQWTVSLLTRSAHKLYRTQIQAWLADKFAESAPYSQIVKELITATGSTQRNGAVNFVAAHLGDPLPNTERGEFGSHEMVPITSRVTRLFLGLQTQCCQCHDHPFNKEWTQHDFWGVNAFFRQLSRDRAPTTTTGNNQQMMANPVQVTISDDPAFNKSAELFFDDREAKRQGTRPRFLDDYKVAQEQIDNPKGRVKKGLKRIPSNSTGKTRREILADYVVAHDNFAKAYVSRVWGHLFGRGFHKEPSIDDFGSNNEIVHPELLERLAGDFARYNYNTKLLLEWICNSDAYNLSHTANKEYSEEKYDPYFARMPLKALTPEVLYDSLITATRFDPAVGDGETAKAARKKAREDWLAKLVRNFGDDEGNELTFNGTVVQALMMMNGREMNDAVTKKSSNIVEDIVQKHARGGLAADRAIVDELFLAAVGRHVTPEEYKEITMIQLGKINQHKEPAPVKPSPGTGTKPTPKPALPAKPGKPMEVKPAPVGIPFYQDLFWALLNTSEFMLNH